MNADREDNDDNASQSSCDDSCETFSSDEIDGPRPGGRSRWFDYYYEHGGHGGGHCPIEDNSELIVECYIAPYDNEPNPDWDGPDDPDDPTPFPSVWIKLGCSIGKNTNLKKVLISSEGCEREHHNYGAESYDDLFSQNNIGEFCSGLSNNRSLTTLRLIGFNFVIGPGSVDQFVMNNHNLVDLRFSECALDLQDMQLLASAFRRRTKPNSIKILDLSNNGSINSESVPYIVEIANHCPKLKRFDLHGCNIGNGGCTGLASIIANPQSKLKCLTLDYNRNIGNEGVVVLGDALSNNKTLECLGLFNPYGMPTTGWDAFERILCDKSSINATYVSNHTLVRLWPRARRQTINAININNMNFSEGLRFYIETNEISNKTLVAREKIFHCHLSGNFGMVPFTNDMDLKLLPQVLGWVGNANRLSKRELIASCWAFYRILRNLPDLCGFLSTHGIMRLRLEEEIASLRNDNTALKQENEQLRLENEELRSNKRQRKD